MITNSPDINTFKHNLDNCIAAVKKNKQDSQAGIKIQSLLNVTIYVMATRFLEASVKHIVYNCCIMRGDDKPRLEMVASQLRKFNNPEFQNIKTLFAELLSFDIMDGIRTSDFSQSDITRLNQIVENRHQNVHASFDSAEWYNTNKKDIDDFAKEYEGLLNIISYLDKLTYEKSSSSFKAS